VGNLLDKLLFYEKLAKLAGWSEGEFIRNRPYGGVGVFLPLYRNGRRGQEMILDAQIG
jgi:hypothetical protein